MGSKAIVFLGLFLAVLLLTTPTVTAMDAADHQQTNGVDDAKDHHGGGHGGGYHGGGGHHGGHYGGGHGGGHGRGGGH